MAHGLPNVTYTIVLADCSPNHTNTLVWKSMAHQTLRVQRFSDTWLTKPYKYNCFPCFPCFQCFLCFTCFTCFTGVLGYFVFLKFSKFSLFSMFSLCSWFSWFSRFAMFLMFSMFFLGLLSGARAGAVGQKVSPCRCHFLCLPPPLKFMPVRGRARSP